MNDNLQIRDIIAFSIDDFSETGITRDGSVRFRFGKGSYNVHSREIRLVLLLTEGSKARDQILLRRRPRIGRGIFIYVNSSLEQVSLHLIDQKQPLVYFLFLFRGYIVNAP